MKNIQFHDIQVEKMSADELTAMFARIKEEIEWHKFSYKVCPYRIHVYGNFLNMMAGHDATSRTLVMCV